MEDVIKHLQKELASLRTGRLLDHLRVELYGDHMPMKACGTATVRDPQLLVFNAFDPSTSETIAKAIRDSPLGLNPRVEGQDILVPVPRPTAESLKAMKKVCKQEGEQAKASIRHQRKVAMDLAKKAASEDDKFRHGKEVEALTQEFVAAIDSLVQAKEKAIADHSA
ncbi:hypothetical protein QBZ16_001715 [Prototheca wickerhamii]|uniref:Ribosome-recycling factor, chloroplastic n=1 Tax=Prototheca wickerhamii TaxID=3111 RepID=A0AAD9IG07_PROWI|nr:hypothetical protein QBZ16_001715 [Prototheca wickerhamii]